MDSGGAIWQRLVGRRRVAAMEGIDASGNSVSLGAAFAPGPTVGTQTSVADSATSATLLASNAARKGAVVWNDSTALLYLLLGAGTASATVHSVQLLPGTGYELPMSKGGPYTGIIVGIWASDASGSARVTEFT